MDIKFNSNIFDLKKSIADIKNYNSGWNYSDTFEKFVSNLNKSSEKLSLPNFNFEGFHYSSSGKTINEIGYTSLINHVNLLEEMLPSIVSSRKFNENVEPMENQQDGNKVFIVHGRDKTALLETEGILSRARLEPIVLNRMVNGGLTLIEKFEKYSKVKYAIVLLTPDDIGALYENKPLESLELKYRARQNVLFELGFFYGKLGRSNVCCILKSNVEKPSDIDGLAYLQYSQSVEEIEYLLLKELQQAKLSIHM